MIYILMSDAAKAINFPPTYCAETLMAGNLARFLPGHSYGGVTLVSESEPSKKR